MKAIIFLLLISMGSVYAQDISGSVSNITKLKGEALSTLGSTPYRAKEHQLIKDYFVGLMEFSVQARDNSKMNRRLNSYLASGDIAKFCSDILLDTKDWNQIKQNCTRNRFFLCSEEVNEFPEFKKTLSGSLSPANLEIFKNTPACQ